MAARPTKIPSYPAKILICGSPVKSAKASKKNKSVNPPNTNCKEFVNLNVAMNIPNVNNPHMNKYAAMAIEDGGSASPNFGSNNIPAKDNQKKP